MSNLHDDPKFTLFALGQLSPEESKEFEMKMQNDSEAQNEFNDIQKMAGVLKEEFSKEQLSRLNPEQIETISKVYEGKKLWKRILPFAVSLCVVVVGVQVKRIADQKYSELTGDVFSKTSGIKQEIGSSNSSEMVVSNSIPAAPPAEAAKEYHTEARAVKRKMAPQPLAKGSGSIGFYQADMMAQVEAESGYNTESYDHVEHNQFVRVADEPLSTFSVDVDTASYSNARRFFNNAQLPPKESIRVEEFINYFDYSYKSPAADSKHPVAIFTEMANSPFHSKYKLVKIGLKAREMMMESRPKSNLVFLIDVSGSMSDPNKLPLVKESMKEMVRKMDGDEKISIVVYAGASGMALAPTNASEIPTIFEALGNLNAGGSTNGGAGIELAYKTAQENFIKEGNNRVILVTDGDFNIGQTSQGSLVDIIKEKAKSNIFLTVLGVGMGNYKDSTLEKLADYGNGNYAYIDNLNEARKVLINDRFKTLHTVAKDVKLQVEFNPAQIQAYRLIGYENRKLANKDFNDDKKDAGDMGAGHTVTAFYEVIPAGVKTDDIPSVDALKYQAKNEIRKKSDAETNEALTVKLRYKEPTGSKSKLLEEALVMSDRKFSEASSDFQFATSVAGFAMILRDEKQLGDVKLSWLLEVAEKNQGEDQFHYRQEFIENMKIAKKIVEKTRKWE